MYETFREIVTERFKDYLPRQYRRAEVAVYPIKKINCILDDLREGQGPPVSLKKRREMQCQCRCGPGWKKAAGTLMRLLTAG